MSKIDILIAGVGGQGTILAGNLISRLGVKENLDVKTAETHGMAQRGGSVITHVRLADKVYSPLIPRGDIDYLLSFEKLEALRNLPFLVSESTIIYNAQQLNPLPVLTGADEYPPNISEEITSKVKNCYEIETLDYEPVKTNPRVLNTFLIGVLSYFLPFEFSSWEKVLHEVLPPKLLEINQEALRAGYKWSEKSLNH